MSIGRLGRGVRRIFVVFFLTGVTRKLFGANMIKLNLLFHFLVVVAILDFFFFFIEPGRLRLLNAHLLCNLIGTPEQVLHLFYPHIFVICILIIRRLHADWMNRRKIRTFPSPQVK